MISFMGIEILLAVYNGEPYLGDLLKSIEAQTRRDWRLVARDDGSTDGSRRVIESFAARDARFRLLEDGAERLGIEGNFARLLSRSTADYVMFCDHDDVWRPAKIEKTLALLQGLERTHGKARPLLAHTDLEVVDAGLNPLGASFWKYSRLDPERGASFNRLLMQNVVTGCAAMINGALRELVGAIPPEAVMHDWWLALAASAFGAIGFLQEPTILYRQHGANDVGARALGVESAAKIALDPGYVRRRLDLAYRQARKFNEIHGSRLPRERREVLEAFCGLNAMGPFQRRRTILRHGFLKTGFLKNLGLLAYA